MIIKIRLAGFYATLFVEANKLLKRGYTFLKDVTSYIYKYKTLKNKQHEKNNFISISHLLICQ